MSVVKAWYFLFLRLFGFGVVGCMFVYAADSGKIDRAGNELKHHQINPKGKK